MCDGTFKGTGEAMFEHRNSLIEVDMSEYMESTVFQDDQFPLSGYVGYEEVNSSVKKCAEILTA